MRFPLAEHGQQPAHACPERLSDLLEGTGRPHHRQPPLRLSAHRHLIAGKAALRQPLQHLQPCLIPADPLGQPVPLGAQDLCPGFGLGGQRLGDHGQGEIHLAEQGNGQGITCLLRRVIAVAGVGVHADRSQEPRLVVVPELLDAERRQAGEPPDGEEFFVHAVMVDSPTVGESTAVPMGSIPPASPSAGTPPLNARPPWGSHSPSVRSVHSGNASHGGARHVRVERVRVRGWGHAGPE